MKKVILYLISIAFLSTACNSFLDVKPKGFSIPEEYKDYEFLMFNDDLVRATPVFPDLLADNVRPGERKDPIELASFDRYQPFFQRLYRWDSGAVYDNNQSDSFWEGAYKHIFIYNSVINNVLESTGSTEKEKRSLWASAKLGRAFEYFHLVNLYSKHYSAQSASQDLGVPLFLVEDINHKYERVTVQRIYDVILQDLTEAAAYLPTISANKYSPNKRAADAFLSRVYLFQGKYDLALQHARAVLKEHDQLLDYKAYGIRPYVTNGRIVELANQKEVFPEAGKNIETVWGRTPMNQLFGYLNEYVYATTDLVATYQKNLPQGATDQRFNLYFSTDVSNLRTSPVSIPGKSLWSPYIGHVNTGFSTSEMYLIAAECEARIGLAQEALKLINKLRDARIINNQAIASLDKAELLKIVLEERRREFPVIASMRLMDLKRLYTSGDYQHTLTHQVEQEVWQLELTDNRLILPVPPKVLDSNPTIPVYDR